MDKGQKHWLKWHMTSVEGSMSSVSGLLIEDTSLRFSDKSKRRTKTVKKLLEPKWNQTFVYSHVHRRDFRERMLEITVWDQPRVQDEESEFLGEVMYTVSTEPVYCGFCCMLIVGTFLLCFIWEILFQILIELETGLLDDEPHWYKLQTHDESSLPLPQPSPFMPRRHIHGESSSKKLQSRFDSI